MHGLNCNEERGSEVKKRVQAGWNCLRRMSGVICDKRVPARVKGKVYMVAVRPALLYGWDAVREDMAWAQVRRRMQKLGPNGDGTSMAISSLCNLSPKADR